MRWLLILAIFAFSDTFFNVAHALDDKVELKNFTEYKIKNHRVSISKGSESCFSASPNDTVNAGKKITIGDHRGNCAVNNTDTTFDYKIDVSGYYFVAPPFPNPMTPGVWVQYDVEKEFTVSEGDLGYVELVNLNILVYRGSGTPYVIIKVENCTSGCG